MNESSFAPCACQHLVLSVLGDFGHSNRSQCHFKFPSLIIYNVEQISFAFQELTNVKSRLLFKNHLTTSPLTYLIHSTGGTPSSYSLPATYLASERRINSTANCIMDLQEFSGGTTFWQQLISPSVRSTFQPLV